MKAAALALLAAALLGNPGTRAAAAEPCVSGGLPGLAAVASKLRVAPVENSFVMDCAGRGYPIGGLLLAAVVRIEKAEKDAAEARLDAATTRALLTTIEKRSP